MYGAGLSGTPSSSSTLPSSVTLRTKCPPSSVRNIVSSGAMWTPCARGYSPSPHDRRKLPSRSNTIIGCSPRLNTQTLSLLSTPTPPTSLKDQPAGNFAQSASTRYLYFPVPTIIETFLLVAASVCRQYREYESSPPS